MVTDSSNLDSTAPVPEREESTAPQKMEWRDLADGRRPTYGEIKKKFKSEGVAGSRSSFVLSELVANQLSVEQEEKNRFEKRVNDELENRLGLIKTEAFQKGHKEGEEQGCAKAYDEEKARLVALQEKLALAIKDVAEAKTYLAEQYEEEIVKLSFRIAEVVLHNHIDEHPDFVKNVIKAILERISREEDVRIKISAHSFEGISAIDKEIQTIVRDGRVTFELDGALPKGACIVESQSGEYGSFIEQQMTILKSEFLNQHKKKISADGDGQKAG